MKKNSLFILFLLFAGIAFGQSEPEKETKSHTPNLPGLFLVDLGVNVSIHAPDTWNQGFWGSRTVNVYYQYPFRFGKSKFSFNPGFGLSLERWKFNDGATLINEEELGPGGVPAATQIEQYNLLNANTIYPKAANKSMFVTNYFEIPVEFRFDTKPEDLARSFNFAVGGRIGFLYDAFTKVRYTDLGEVVKIKNKLNHGLETMRYGVYTRVGIGSLSAFMFYNLSDMFQDNKGPKGTNMNSLTVGIGLNGF
ncbi:MAG: PorT family protein [Cyclobacteriaceae bacterium]|jgi:hypothetical protein|nr:PorT family protein [Cyclobacteriaceae bacterium]